jgi:hypothetical protein
MGWMVDGNENQAGDRRLAGASGLWQGVRVMSASATMVEPPRIPAPPELVARAEALVKEYEIACFWFWHPEARVRYLDDVRLVVHHLREYGNHKAWQAAQELNKCL